MKFRLIPPACQHPLWMRNVLLAAALYNLIWGAWVVLFPDAFFNLVGMSPPHPDIIWRGMGMVIGVYGLGYYWASYNPIRHWPIVAVGFLGKIFGPIGYFVNLVTATVPAEFGYTLITNDFIWWIPFFLILKRAHENSWTLN